MSIKEIIGLVAAILIVFSMMFKTTSFKGTILMRVINTLGAVFFIIYGFTLPALSTGICNVAVLLLNLFYLYKEIKDHKKETTKNEMHS